MRLPESLLAWVHLQAGRYTRRDILPLLSEAFFDLRSRLILGSFDDEGVVPRWRQIAQVSVGVFDWHIVASLLAEEGYQPYVDTLPVPASVPPQVRRAAQWVLAYLQSHPEAESAYQELASRTVVGAAAEVVGISLRDLVILLEKGEMTRDEQHRELANLFPMICSVWVLGRDVLKAEHEGRKVEWRPIVFQGLT